ncbi:MAG: hypothetical protein V4692_15875 [Bdellovibrionota bacterium]
MNNEKGFGLVSFLSLIPLLLAMGVFVAAAMSLLKVDAQAKHMCRTELLRSQEKISGRLEQLLKMNNLAKALRIERAAADAAVLAAAAYPLVLPVALAAQQAVVVQQSVLAAAQNTLIATARLESKLAPARSILEVRKAISSNLFESRLVIVGSSLRTGDFPLRSSPKSSPTPDYDPTNDFSDRQKMKLKLTVLVSSLLPEWMHGFVDLRGLKLETVCTATIAKEPGDRRWSAVLKPDNS